MSEGGLRALFESFNDAEKLALSFGFSHFWLPYLNILIFFFCRNYKKKKRPERLKRSGKARQWVLKTTQSSSGSWNLQGLFGTPPLRGNISFPTPTARINASPAGTKDVGILAEQRNKKIVKTILKIYYKEKSPERRRFSS